MRCILRDWSHKTGASCRRGGVPRVRASEPVPVGLGHGFRRRNPWHPPSFLQAGRNRPGILATISILLAVLCLAMEPVARAEPPEAPRPLHPPFKLLDAAGRPVIESGRPVSTMTSCGVCHDTSYIAAHSYHALAGADRIGTGLFGRWDPLTYGPAGPKLDLAEWVRHTRARHVGGGPAQALKVEMDCFLCHLSDPDHQARQNELAAGRFEWAATATLAATGVAERTEHGWTWDKKAFTAEGEPIRNALRPRATTSRNCGQCHGAVQTDLTPFVLPPGQTNRSTETKGEVFSAQLLRNSGLNLADKDQLARPFDIHAERLLQCGDCHSTINNPAQFSGVARNTPEHLVFEPRRVSPGDYLMRPNHNLAKGHTPQGTVAREIRRHHAAL